MNLKIKFKSSIFYALLLSFLLILLQGFTVAVVFTLTNKEHLSYAFGYLLALIIIIFKFRVTLIKDAKSFKEDIKGNVKNLVLYHASDNDLENRKRLYTEEARQYFNGNIYVPDDLNVIEL